MSKAVKLKEKEAITKKPAVAKKGVAKKIKAKTISIKKDEFAHNRKKMKKRIKTIIEEMEKIKHILKNAKSEGLDKVIDLPVFEEHIKSLNNSLTLLNQKK